MAILTPRTSALAALAQGTFTITPATLHCGAGVYAYQDATHVLYVGMAKDDLVNRAYGPQSRQAHIRDCATEIVLVSTPTVDVALKLKASLIEQFRPLYNRRGIEREVHRNQVGCAGCGTGVLLDPDTSPPICANLRCRRQGAAMTRMKAMMGKPLRYVFCVGCGRGMRVGAQAAEAGWLQCGNPTCPKLREALKMSKEVEAHG